MDDLISKQVIIDGFYEMASDTDHLCTVKDFVEWVEALPSTQLERKKGKWCFNTDGKLVCSNCYETPTNRILLYDNMIFDMTPIRKKMKYCPSCGADMRDV